MLLFENIDRETLLFVKYMFENLNILKFGNLSIWNNQNFNLTSSSVSEEKLSRNFT